MVTDWQTGWEWNCEHRPLPINFGGHGGLKRQSSSAFIFFRQKSGLISMTQQVSVCLCFELLTSCSLCAFKGLPCQEQKKKKNSWKSRRVGGNLQNWFSLARAAVSCDEASQQSGLKPFRWPTSVLYEMFFSFYFKAKKDVKTVDACIQMGPVSRIWNRSSFAFQTNALHPSIGKLFSNECTYFMIHQVHRTTTVSL